MVQANEHHFRRLESQMSRGEPVLFLGAGFSLEAKNQSGQSMPRSSELAQELWRIAFPDDEFDQDASLGDVYHCALSRSRRQLQSYIHQRFTVNSDTLPEFYRTWFSMPWHLCYTLNIDDLEAAAIRAFALPRDIRSISATTGRLGDSRNRESSLTVVHVNGMLSDDVEHLTFSERSYGERLATPDSWLIRCAADLLGRPVVFVGTELHEPTLWRYIESRNQKGGRHARELRPGSYFVTPILSKARQVLLEELNVDWIPMCAEEFATSWLNRLRRAAESGFDAISASRTAEERSTVPSLVSELSTVQVRRDSDYLLGQQPTWSDLQSGRAIVRESDERVYSLARDALESSEVSTPLLLCGTAGAGKSTSLMRLALRLSADGVPVYWIDESSNIRPFQLRQTILEHDGPVGALIDDADLWGRTLTNWAIEIPQSRPGVLFCAALRSSRIDGLVDAHSLGGVKPAEIPVPNLSNSDINALIDVLDRENRLGILKGLSRDRRIRAFRQQAGRQLLVGMIQATSGYRFTEKVFEEFTELEAPQDFLYGLVCIVSSQRYTIDRNELLLAFGRADNETLNALETLHRRHLIVRQDIHSGYGARHRVIAEELIRHVEFRQWFAPMLEGIIFAFSNSVNPSLAKSDRRWRRLIRFINHDYLMRLLSVEDVRSTYERIESVLNWDYHYWLQRGSLEVEVGDLSLATNFLDQARSLASGDRLVENEYAYLLMKKAASDPWSSGAADMFNDGYEMLEALIRSNGKRSPHPYHVLGSQVLAWVRRAPLAPSEKIRLLNSTLTRVAEGVRVHPKSDDLITLREDVQRELLSMAVVDRD